MRGEERESIDCEPVVADDVSCNRQSFVFRSRSISTPPPLTRLAPIAFPHDTLPPSRFNTTPCPLPQVVVVAGAASGTSCIARGPGLLKAAAGVPAIVAVLVQDHLGNAKNIDDPHSGKSTVSKSGLHAYLVR